MVENDCDVIRRILEFMIIENNCKPMGIQAISHGVLYSGKGDRKGKVRRCLLLLENLGKIRMIVDGKSRIKYFPIDFLNISFLQKAKLKGIDLRDRSEEEKLIACCNSEMTNEGLNISNTNKEEEIRDDN